MEKCKRVRTKKLDVKEVECDALNQIYVTQSDSIWGQESCCFEDANKLQCSVQ